VLALLLKMRYGGSRKDPERAMLQSGDGSIEGIILKDGMIQLGVWRYKICRSPPNETREYVTNIDRTIVLDSKELTQIMIDYDVGVSRLA
jgi:restriction endonuclease Mrr